MSQHKYPDARDKIALAFMDTYEPYKGYWKKSENYALCLAQKILKERKARRLLDIGCGEGRLLEKFSEQFEYVLAIDRDPIRIMRTIEKIREQDITNTQVVCSDFRNIGFNINSFDAILCSHVLQHIHTDDLQSFIRTSYQILKPRGILVLLTTHSKRNHDIFRKVFMQNNHLMWEVISQSYFNDLICNDSEILPVQLFSIAKIENLLRRNFSILKLWVFNEFYLDNITDRFIFRDHVINLSLLKPYFGGDMMIVAEKL